MKYVSFSLWGDKPIYNVGAVKNAKLMESIYPDWKMILYYDKTVPITTISELKKYKIELIDMTDSKIYGEFWRFLTLSKPDVEYTIFRDCDSRIGVRERDAVNDWISSGKKIHLMRDHPYHRIPAGNNTIGILAGMWGYKGINKKIEDDIFEFQKTNSYFYGVDQKYLKNIFTLYENDRCTHDDFFEKKPFPTKREDTFFVGGRIDENDRPVGNDHLILLRYDNKLRTSWF